MPLLHASFLTSHPYLYARYAIGTAERPRLANKVGWLDALANETHEFYGPNGTGGPTIKVGGVELSMSFVLFCETEGLNFYKFKGLEMGAVMLLLNRSFKVCDNSLSSNLPEKLLPVN